MWRSLYPRPSRAQAAKSAALSRRHAVMLLHNKGRTEVDIGTWLGSLGLDQYKDLFREHEIETDILPELTDQHLRDIGVPLGHRLRLLRAIRQLVIEGPPASDPWPQDNSERRQLTVMFCDLVGSTALTAQLDPEDMADLIRAFQGAVAAAIARFDGHVA